MPQGRHKVPFSAKQKKQQLKQKRDHRKRHLSDGKRSEDNESTADEEESAQESTIVGAIGGQSSTKGVKQINVQKGLDKNKDVNRYALKFFEESQEEIRERRENSRKPFEFLTENQLEVSVEEVFTADSRLDMPKRPEWRSEWSTAQLEANEQKYFRQYLDSMVKTNDKLSYFELNLETWRQLWRVLEMSDIVLLIGDIRHPVFHFPPSLYDYVVKEMKKDMILVLNKVDLVDSPLVIAWTQYLKKSFPELHVIPFASYAGMKTNIRNKKRIGKLRMASNAAKALQEVCQQICGRRADLTNWRIKIEDELREELSSNQDDFTDEDDDNGSAKNPLKTCEQRLEKLDLNYYKQTERFKDGIVTIGCVGHPNVGKSSLLNAIMGRKVVSVSRTPGHTKHFQTIYLTPTVRLCDCPGLVFPSRAPKELQVLMGCFPIAQLREPYSAIGYISQRIPVHRILKLVHPNQEGKAVVEHQWSAYDICEAWALKRGFLTAKAARPDVYRAANHMLRMALDGRTLCLAFFPPNYTKERVSKWSTHPDIKFMDSIRGRKLENDSDDEIPVKTGVGGDSHSEDEEEDESSGEESTQFGVKSKFSVLQDME